MRTCPGSFVRRGLRMTLAAKAFVMMRKSPPKQKRFGWGTRRLPPAQHHAAGNIEQHRNRDADDKATGERGADRNEQTQHYPNQNQVRDRDDGWLADI